MEAIDALERSPVFSGVPRTLLKEMAQTLVRETWPGNCDVQAVPDNVSRFRLIVRGRVKICRSDSQNGREVTLWLLGPGDVFDIIALLDDELHVISAWTLDEVETLSAPVSAFRDWLDRSPHLRSAMCRYIARQLCELAELATDLALHDTLSRLARLLVRHFDESKGNRTAGTNLIRDLPQEELASLVGSVRVVISRLLAQLKKQAIVEIRHGALRVLDLKRLLRIASPPADPAAEAGKR